MKNIQLEICVDSIKSALAAQEGEASRVELCGDLISEGTTPSAGMIALARKVLTIRLHVMIRPRSGDFCYSDAEFEVMKWDIITAKQFGADGVVFGVLTKEYSVDVARTKELIALARPMSVTFHRAFDVVQLPLQSLEEIIQCGCNRLLTSGQANTAEEGLPLLKELVHQANGRIIIMPASGITLSNINRIIEETGAGEIHVGKAVCDVVEYSDARMFNAKRQVVNANKVQEMLKEFTTPVRLGRRCTERNTD
ncbi:MAG: copper homeostasis protein CutC [Ignavibacteriae bacterium]|nr:copper homeostasis protein CutC [Ignavibacteriota bacterium]